MRDRRYWVGTRHVGVSWKPKEKKQRPWFALFCLTFFIIACLMALAHA
jgi:hypothetical protein